MESNTELTPKALQSIQLLPSHNLSSPRPSVASDSNGTLYSPKSEFSLFDPTQFPQPPRAASPSSTHQSPALARSRSEHRSRVSLDATPLKPAAELHRPSSPKLPRRSSCKSACDPLWRYVFTPNLPWKAGSPQSS